jgi:NAD(P) transhydrogenase subunit alpha
MIVGCPRERSPGETRVAITPTSAASLVSKGHRILIEPNAGTPAGFLDSEYAARDQVALVERASLFQQADLIAQVRVVGPGAALELDDLALMRPGQVLVGLADPLGQPRAAHVLAQKGVTLLALELLPRISRAQSMDVLSSMAMVAGYKAVIEAAAILPRMFPLMMTAAGTLTPAKVLVIGAGVAGLQAIATAKRLGAVVKAYDVRAAARAEVESLGANFLEIPLEIQNAEDAGGYARAMDDDFYNRQRNLLADALADSDVLITTAAVPGKRAPLLITSQMLQRMKPGSVVVDLAAATGGNCELTQPDQLVSHDGISILGPTNLPASVPFHASQMYARNLAAFLLHLSDKDGNLVLNLADEITSGTLVTHAGQVVHPRVRQALSLDPLPITQPAAGAS